MQSNPTARAFSSYNAILHIGTPSYYHGEPVACKRNIAGYAGLTEMTDR